jgi:hypothetical protein
LHRWHGKRRWTVFDNGNFRTADLGHPGISFQPYDDKPSKVTGEDCFHLEAKINSVRALRQLGINSISDLFTFDHAKFWQRISCIRRSFRDDVHFLKRVGLLKDRAPLIPSRIRRLKPPEEEPFRYHYGRQSRDD